MNTGHFGHLAEIAEDGLFEYHGELRTPYFSAPIQVKPRPIVRDPRQRTHRVEIALDRRRGREIGSAWRRAFNRGALKGSPFLQIWLSDRTLPHPIDLIAYRRPGKSLWLIYPRQRGAVASLKKTA